ncbi:MAG: RuBisCO accumulation factor 1 [Cyanobacteria bacterium P01_E01_bin.6]
MSANSSQHSNPSPHPLSDDEIQALMKALRRKEGTWIHWGQRCQALQQTGQSPQQIFEGTGFEPIQQNQVIVASQVYAALLNQGTPESVRSHFQQRGSDVLYEFRILTQPERAVAATLVVEKGADIDDAREIAKAIKAYSRLSSSPNGFSDFDNQPGDAIAYHYWKLARQQSDLQNRSRLIAQGLRFAQSLSARQMIEKLLTDFTVVKARSAPTMPFYRMDTEEDIPRVVPVAGRLPLETPFFKEVPLIEEEGTFKVVKFAGTGAWVSLPGWQVVLTADDPVVVLGNTIHLPVELSGDPEEILMLIDRSQRDWNADSYFLGDVDGKIQVLWSEEPLNTPLLGRLVLALKPRRILDEEFLKQPWQLDE